MRMMWFLCIGLTCAFVHGDAPKAQSIPPASKDASLPPIREFDLDTLARLGRDIFRHDQMAWQATDIVMERIGLERLQAEGASGWVVDESGPLPMVRFLRRTGDRLEAACDVQFPLMGSPTLTIPKDRSITPRQAARSGVRDAAMKRMMGGEFPICPLNQGSYNYVVLDDPAGGGFLFYLLRPKESMDSIPVGGHYRLSIAEDGKTVRRVDRLSASCLTLKRPAEGRAEATWMTHVASNTPIEIHVFLSLQEKSPFYVGTPDRRLWKVEEGKIQYLETLDAPAAKAGESQP